MSGSACWRTASVAALLALASCGPSGPTRQDVEAAIRRMGQQQLAAANAAIGPLSGRAAQMFEVPEVRVTDLSCTAERGGVFRCIVTVELGGATRTQAAEFKRVHGIWTVIG